MISASVDRARALPGRTVRHSPRHPRPSGTGLEEYRTADLVAQKLEEWGIEVHRGVGKTGVVGVLRNGNGQAAIGLRADMDALPILEATGLPLRQPEPRPHARLRP
jgi:metal-dependent amidase/aminoacylase/carboxypeptidase family protein